LAYRDIHDNNFISGGDLVIIKHSEYGGTLSADVDYNFGMDHVFIRKYDGDFVLEEFSVQSVWEIENV